MTNSAFNDEEKRCVVDLLVLGMYADRNLSSAEDKRLQKFLDQFGFATDYERQSFSDAAFTRVTRHTGSAGAVAEYVKKLATDLASPEARRRAYDALNDLLASDGSVSAEEQKLLDTVKVTFGL
jgi:hypothetical protein